MNAQQNTKQINKQCNLFSRAFSKYSSYNSIAGRIASIYILISLLWILLSDKMLYLLINEEKLVAVISIIKGWLFVLATGAIIYALIKCSLKKVQAAENALKNSYEDTCHHLNELLESQQKLWESEEKLHYLAYHDPLTGLPNKLNLFERLTQYFTSGNDHKSALFFINLDNFKRVNDALGQSFGDQFMILISKRLETLISGGGSLYRLNGDEFVMFVESIGQVEQLERMAIKILEGFIEPFLFDDSIIYLSVSIGISIFPEHGICSEELLKCAQIAMYKAKNLGKKRYIIFDPTLNEIIAERIRIEKYLHSALDNNEFELCYQPQVDLETGKIAGFEALLRWDNPYLGKISPERFIKIAEENQLIIPIGKWVLQNACNFLGELQQQGYKNLSVSVNLSILQLMQNDFVDTVFQLLKSANVAPQFLELEITESLLMESFDLVGCTLKKLKEKGIKIALDDFGKGYSSLNYLKQLPISTLKIDKTFIDTITPGGNDKSLIEPVILLGQMLELCVIAEGVETPEQLEYLIKHKCDRIQGYLFSKPVAQSEVLELLIDSKKL